MFRSASALRNIELSFGKLQEDGPVGAGGVAAAVLAVGDFAFNECGLYGGELVGAQIFFAEKAINGAGCGSGHEHAFGIGPSVAFVASAANEDGAGGAHGNDLVGINR